MTPSRVLWAVPCWLTLHNAEEALALRVLLPTLRAHVPPGVQGLVGTVSYATFLGALGLLTVLAFVATAWAVARPQGPGPWLVAALQATVALNVVAHVGTALVLGRYVPGLITAVLVNAPFSWYFFRRSTREHWLSRRAQWGTLPAALLLHGPGIVGVLLLARWLSAAG